MMNKIRKPLVFTLVLLPAIIAAAFFAVLMTLPTADPAAVDEAVKKLSSREAFIAVSTVQPVLTAVLCAFFGCILSVKTGLMRPFGPEKKKLAVTLTASLISGAVLSLDAWTFAKIIPQVADSYKAAASFDAVTWAGSILYGGIVEELMMRLFLMSLLAFIVWKLFFKKSETVPAGVLVAANIISALAFAAGHLPSTAALFGTLTPMIIVRCFLLNGAFGAVFGRLYRKSGIQYAMLAHALCHVVSRTIWLICL